MKKHYRYTFEVSHDAGKFFLSVVSYSQKRAKQMVCDAEHCPKNAVVFVTKRNINL